MKSPGSGGVPPLISALGRKREKQEDLCEFETSLVYRASSRTGTKATERNPVSKTKTNKKMYEPMITAKIWMNHEDLLRKISQTQKENHGLVSVA